MSSMFVPNGNKTQQNANSVDVYWEVLYYEL